MAMDWLVPALDLRPAEVQEMTPRQFQQAWTSIAFLYAGLHPDEATKDMVKNNFREPHGASRGFFL